MYIFNFFRLVIFKVFIGCVTILFLFFLMFWFFGHEACGILIPQPGIEVEGKVLTTRLPGKSQECMFGKQDSWVGDPELISSRDKLKLQPYVEQQSLRMT